MENIIFPRKENTAKTATCSSEAYVPGQEQEKEEENGKNTGAEKAE